MRKIHVFLLLSFMIPAFSVNSGCSTKVVARYGAEAAPGTLLENQSDSNEPSQPPAEPDPAAEEEVSPAEEEVVTNPPADLLVLVNKNVSLPADYVPPDLVIPQVPFPFAEDLPKKYMRKEAAAALELLFAGARNEDLQLFAQSGYRSYDTQEVLFAAYVKSYGMEKTVTFSAQAGQSEHQTGLAMDVTSPAVKFNLVDEFAGTTEGIWLQDHAGEYGFIIRFPRGKEEVTGYQYEPWHLRYVGKEAAREITEYGLALEEYIMLKSAR